MKLQNLEDWTIKAMQYLGMIQVEDVKLDDEWKDAF